MAKIASSGIRGTRRRFRPATVTGKRVAGRGLVVAFIGSDGSGKSTLTREMRAWLRYKLDVHGYYMGSGQGSTRLLDKARHAVKAKTKKTKQPKVPRAAGEAPRKPPGFLGRLVALHQLPAIRAKLRPRGFSLVLIDKDGEAKLRKPLPWDVREITHAIDKFPLRRQEILGR